MSLNFDLSNVQHNDELHVVLPNGENDLAPMTKSIVFMTMAIGMGEITEKNYREWFERASSVEAVHGPMILSYDQQFITLEDVMRHIGLSTNVFPKTPRKKFYSNLAEAALKKSIQKHKNFIKNG